MKPKLSKSMTLEQFENGYWYATQIKEFADQIGIPSANKLRKDELEISIKFFLQTGKIKLPTKRSLSKSGPKDLEKGLSLDLPVVNYTSNKETKAFILSEAQKMSPGLKKKSGARYRLNRWREEQLTKGIKITYGEKIRRVKSAGRTLRSNSGPQIYQLSQRFFCGRKRCNERASYRSVEAT
jgi:SAP domain-containing new25